MQWRKRLTNIILPIIFGVSLGSILVTGIFVAVNFSNKKVSHNEIGTLSVEQAEQAFGKENITFNEHNCSIIGYSKPSDVSEIILPSKINGLDVIYTREFQQQFREQMDAGDAKSHVKTLYIPNLGFEHEYNFITNAGVDASIDNQDTKIIFSNLESVQLDDSITELPDSFFSGCTNLTTINIPNSLEEIPSYFLKDTAISSLYIPSNIKKIGTKAFEQIDSLINVYFDESLTEIEIDSQAFSNCSKLKVVNFNNLSKITPDLVETNPTFGLKWWIFYGSNVNNSFEILLPESLYNDLTRLQNKYYNSSSTENYWDFNNIRFITK